MNNKGFLLAESIIVAVFILGMFVFLASNILPLVAKYDSTLNYDNPNEVYLVNDLYNEIKQSGITLTGTIICRDGSSCSIFDDPYLKKISSHMNIDEIIVYSNQISSNKDTVLKNRGMRAYYNYQHKRIVGTPGTYMLVKFKYSDDNNNDNNTNVYYKYASIQI